MSPKPKIVFLYSEIAGYFIACAKTLSQFADVLIVRWPVNNEAPFKFDSHENIRIVEKSDYSLSELQQLIKNFKPTKIVCSGWMDKDYLKIVKSYKKSIPTVLTLDNHWVGNWKQKAATLASPILLKSKFTHAWVPGSPQIKFAEKLGFNKIIDGFYCADVDLHEKCFDKENIKPVKQFLYVGRYVKHKSIFEMWEAFIQVIEENNITDWEMVCIGTGEEWENRTKHSKIKHMGFVQPQDLKKYVQEKPVYVLPSSFEPWGVSVHEFATMGCPMVVSNVVGAAEKFVEEDKNGVMIEPTVEGLKKAFLKMMMLDHETYKSMCLRSNELGTSYRTSDWSKKILSIEL